MSQDIAKAVGSTCRMPNPRLLITTVVREGRSQAEVARSYTVSQARVNELGARYCAEALLTAFHPRALPTCGRH
jgi:hypothetical protein